MNQLNFVIFRMSRPPAETQSPPIENFLATVLLQLSISCCTITITNAMP